MTFFTFIFIVLTFVSLQSFVSSRNAEEKRSVTTHITASKETNVRHFGFVFNSRYESTLWLIAVGWFVLCYL